MGSQPIAFAVADSKDERYKFVDGVLKRYSYRQLKRDDKGIVIQFLEKVSGYSRQQITRMVQRHVETGSVRRHQKTSNGFNRIYLPEDVQLLVRLDQRHDIPNGLMVKNYASEHTTALLSWFTNVCRRFQYPTSTTYASRRDT